MSDETTPAPVPMHFTVFWTDTNLSSSDFTSITGSTFEDNRLILSKKGRDFIINFDEVRYVGVKSSLTAKEK